MDTTKTKKLAITLLSIIFALAMLMGFIAFGSGAQNTAYAAGAPTGDFITFSSESSFAIAMTNTTKNWEGKLYYSTSGENGSWNEYSDLNATLSAAQIGGTGDYYLCFRGTGNTRISSSASYEGNPWTITGANVACAGNIETLLDYATVATNGHPTMETCCFAYMFANSSALISAPELSAVALTEGCYGAMFFGCTALNTAPALPSMNLGSNCYESMFQNCTALTELPELPATALTSSCYLSMFSGCTGIKLFATDQGSGNWSIPASAIEADAWNSNMLSGTGGDFTGAPVIGATYYYAAPPVATVTFDEDGAGANTAVTTGYTSFEAAWNYAVGLSTTADYRATVKLLDNVTADGTEAHGFGTGAGFGNGSDSSTGCILVPNGKFITLDLNGKTVDRAVGDTQIVTGCVIYNRGNLAITDTSSYDVALQGAITGGNTESGGGVYSHYSSTLTISGGRITGNKASSSGGGVYFNGSTFTISGGSICGNNAYFSGGGVYSYTPFTMTGGTISGNTTVGDGGGVYSATVLTMTGGTITGNNTSGLGGLGGGVRFFGTFNLSGNAEITGNFKNGTLNSTSNLYELGVNGKPSNVFLTKAITISDNDDTTSNDTFSGAVGVISDPLTAGNPLTLTSGWTTTNSGGTITSDNASYMIMSNDGEKALALIAATVTFDANGATDGGVVTTNYATFESAWNAAVALSTSSDYRATVKLLDNWTADTNTKSFGTGAGFTSGAILVPANTYLTLNLNGKTIDRVLGNTAISSGFVISVNGNLVIEDGGTGGAITGGNNNSNNSIGGGIFLSASSSVLTLSGGKIFGNKTDEGGGVGVKAGSFTMTGGEISDNYADIHGGGVRVLSDGTFTMTLGTISNNTANYGAGVGIESDGYFTMDGGEISGNNAACYGGGVYSNSTSLVFTMNGGEISGNNANMDGGGVYFLWASFNLSGDANITANVNGGSKAQGETVYTGGKVNNVYLKTDNTITLSALFTGNVGVTTQTAPTIANPVTLTSGWTSSGTAAAENKGTITSDNESYLVSSNDTEIVIITAQAYVNISPTMQTQSYTGDEVPYIISGTDSDIGNFVVKYALTGTTPLETTVLTAPGKYDVQITRAADDGYYEYDSGVITAGLVINHTAESIIDENNGFITFSSESSFTISARKDWDSTLEYSTDGVTWTTYAGNTVLTAAQIGNTGKYYLCFRGAGNTYMSRGTAWTCSATTAVECNGNIETLLDYLTVANGNHPTMEINCFDAMFQNWTYLNSAPRLPATTLSTGCYANMFNGCTNLTSVPALPAQSLVEECYSSMFRGCTGLTTVPTDLLPASDLGKYCYANMFNGCTNLTSVPALPATSLVEGCYFAMFQGCTGLTTVPTDLLPASDLGDSCYYSMFQGCTGLTNTPVLSSTTMKTSCYSEMFRGCTSLKRVPNLPATSLADNCYYSMFSNCSGIKLYTSSTTGDTWQIPYDATTSAETSHWWSASMFSFTGGDDISALTPGELYYYLPTVTYYDRGEADEILYTGSAIDDTYKTYTSGVAMDLPVVTKEGLTFIGWYTGYNSGYKVTEISSTAEGNLTYYAKFAVTYTVTYDVQGGDTIDPNQIEVEAGETGIRLAIPTRSGYIFNGWYTAASGGTQWSGSDGINTVGFTSDTTIYAQWTQTYTITYNCGTGTGSKTSDTKIKEINKSIDAYALSEDNQAPITKDGHIQVGWAPNQEEYATSGNISYYRYTWYVDDRDVTLYPVWVAKTYTVTLNKNEGTAGGSATATYASVTLTDYIAATRTGYVLNGYFTTTSGGSKVINADGTLVASVAGYTDASGKWIKDGTATLYAQWTAKTYNVMFDRNGGTTGSTHVEGVVYGEEMPTEYRASAGYSVVVAPPIRVGYTFVGYYSVNGGSSTDDSAWGTRYYVPYNAERMASSHIWDIDENSPTLYARWTVNTYAVALTTNGGTINVGDVTTYTYGVGANLPTDVSKTGYTFDGWYTNDGTTEWGDKVTAISNTDTEAKTYYAKWTAKTYAITLDKNDGTAGGSATATYNSVTLTGFTAVTRTGYTVTGYYTSASGGSKVINADGTLVASVGNFTDANGKWVYDGTVTLYAQWEALMLVTTYDASTGYTITGVNQSWYDANKDGEGHIATFTIPETWNDGSNGEHSIVAIANTCFNGASSWVIDSKKIVVDANLTTLGSRAFSAMRYNVIYNGDTAFTYSDRYNAPTYSYYNFFIVANSVMYNEINRLAGFTVHNLAYETEVTFYTHSGSALTTEEKLFGAPYFAKKTGTDWVTDSQIELPTTTLDGKSFIFWAQKTDGGQWKMDDDYILEYKSDYVNSDKYYPVFDVEATYTYILKNGDEIVDTVAESTYLSYYYMYGSWRYFNRVDAQGVLHSYVISSVIGIDGYSDNGKSLLDEMTYTFENNSGGNLQNALDEIFMARVCGNVTVTLGVAYELDGKFNISNCTYDDGGETVEGYKLRSCLQGENYMFNKNYGTLEELFDELEASRLSYHYALNSRDKLEYSLYHVPCEIYFNNLTADCSIYLQYGEYEVSGALTTTLDSPDRYALDIGNDRNIGGDDMAKVTILGGTYVVNAADGSDNIPALIGNVGKLTIMGGTFNSTGYGVASKYELIINGGDFDSAYTTVAIEEGYGKIYGGTYISSGLYEGGYNLFRGTVSVVYGAVGVLYDGTYSTRNADGIVLFAQSGYEGTARGYELCYYTDSDNNVFYLNAEGELQQERPEYTSIEAETYDDERTSDTPTSLIIAGGTVNGNIVNYLQFTADRAGGYSWWNSPSDFGGIYSSRTIESRSLFDGETIAANIIFAGRPTVSGALITKTAAYYGKTVYYTPQDSGSINMLRYVAPTQSDPVLVFDGTPTVEGDGGAIAIDFKNTFTAGETVVVSGTADITKFTLFGDAFANYGLAPFDAIADENNTPDSLVIHNRVGYTAKHWQEDVDQSSTAVNDSRVLHGGIYYALSATDDTLVGTTNTDTAVVANTYIGFNALSFAQQTVAGDGTTNVNVYYDRIVYTITFQIDEASATVNSGELIRQLKFGYSISVPTVSANNGYRISEANGGWNAAIPSTASATTTYNLVTEAITYTVTLDAGSHGEYSVTPTQPQYTIETTGAIQLTAPSANNGYTFDKWIITTAQGSWTAGDYQWTAGNYGNVTVTATYLLNAPVISATSGYAGSYDTNNHNISVTASHDAGYSVNYQWYYNGTAAQNAIVGATTSVYAVQAVAQSGNYYCAVTVTDGTQTKSTTSAVIVVAISKAKATAPTADNTTHRYNGNLQTYVLPANALYTVSNNTRTVAGSQTVTVALNDKSNYEWATGGTTDLSFTFTIQKAQTTITVDQTAIVKTYGEVFSLPTATSNFGSVVCDKTVADLVNANNYTVTYSVAEGDNYLGDSKIVQVTVNKQKVAKPAANTSIYIADGASKTYTVATDSRYTVSGNVKTEVGSYTVTVALNNVANYEWTDGTTTNIAFEFVIRQPQLTEKTDAAAEKDGVIVTADNGFAPEVTVSIVIVEEDEATNVSSNIAKEEEVVLVYDVKLFIGDAETQPDGMIAIKILIPENCVGKNYRILHVHNDSVTEMQYTVDGDYAVVTTDRLSEFVFVADKDVTSLVWLIIILTIIILAEAALAVYKLRKNNKSKKTIKTYSFMPILLAAFVPTGQVGAVIALAGVAICGGLYNAYLYFFKNKLENNDDLYVTSDKANEAVFVEDDALKVTAVETKPIAETTVSALEEAEAEEAEADETEAEDADEEESEVFKGIEEETGLAILVRYRKSFTARLIQAPDETKAYYGTLKNALLSYKKTSSRISWNYDSINSGRAKLAKLNVRGKTLYLYLALNADDYEGTKYKVEKSTAQKYEDTPCLYKIKNERRAKYALELIAKLAEKVGLQKSESKNVDYYLPYETTEALINRELIKELITKEKYESYLLKQQRAEVNSKKRTFVSASEVDSVLCDEVASSLVIYQESSFVGKKVKGIVNIDSISDKYASDETVNLTTLKQKNLLNDSVNYYKVLARGTLNKPLTVEANEFSIEVVKMILLTGGTVIKLS